MQTFEQWFYRCGVRKVEWLTNPPMTPMVDLTLPWYSMIHYLPETSVETGPSFDNLIFQTSGGPRYVDHVLEQATQIGTPIWAKQTPMTLVQSFRKIQPKFRRMTKLEQLTQTKDAMLVENYCILQHLWNYRETYLTPYWRWVNLRNTLWANVTRLAERVPHVSQFVFLQLPDVVPTRGEFAQAAVRRTRDTMAKFNTDAAMDCLDLFIWAGKDRESSAIGAIPDSALAKLNIVFTVGGFWTVINMGKLNQWIKGQGLGSEKEIEAGRDPELFQKTMLAFFNRLVTARSTAESTVGDSKINTATPDLGPKPDQALAEADAKANATTGVVVSGPDVGFIMPEDEEFDIDALLDSFDAPPSSAVQDVTQDIPVAPVVAEKTAITLGDLESGESIVRTFWDLDAPPLNLEELIQPVVSEITKGHTDQLGVYDLGVMGTALKYHDQGKISNAEFARFDELAGRYRTLQVGDTGKTVAELAVIDDAVIHQISGDVAPEIKTVLDKSFLKSSLTGFDRDYITKVLDADIMNAFLAPMKAGFALTGFAKERTHTLMNKFDTYTVAYTPVDGERTVVKLDIPVIEPDGRYRMNGVDYYLKKQRGDLPIRKVAPNKVALTSYYGKLFIVRSDKVAFDYGNWLTRKINSGIEQNNSKYSNVLFGAGISNTEVAPRGYSILANEYIRFNYGEYEFDFRFNKAGETYGEKYVKDPSESMPIGWKVEGSKRTVLTIDRSGIVSLDNEEPLGGIEDLLGIDVTSRPNDAVMVKLLGKNIPLGLVLFWRYGADETLKRLGVNPERIEAGGRLNMTADQYAVRFKDQTLVFPRNNRLAALALSGLNDFKAAIASYDYDDFNGRDAIMNVLEAVNLTARYGHEITNLFDLFIDHITRDILKEMNEPTVFGPLLIRACQLLLTDDCPDETDLRHMRIAGYERIAGNIMRELLPAIRTQRRKQSGRRGGLDLKQKAVWQRIQSDGSSQQVEDSTPIHNLKEQEALTYSGHGGRGKTSMVKSTRAFHPTDIGTVSEATVDSGSVAINTSLVANPRFTSLRGLTARFDPELDGAASLLSTSTLIAAGADRDELRRANFISIQNSSGIATESYETMPVCTGMESVIAHRAGPKFASRARGAGRVVSVNEDAITVEYDDPSLGVDHFPIGLTHGLIAGMTVPHEVITDLKVGDQIKDGTIVAWNERFFTRDPMQPDQVLYKPAFLVRTALVDGMDQLEDSSAISQEVGIKLSTKVSYPVTLIVKPGEVVHDLVQVGSKVDLETILCTIENPLTANADLFKDDAFDTLSFLAAGKTKAGHAGVVDKIEVYYNGDPDSFNDSVAELIRISDRTLARRDKRLGGDGSIIGRVDNTVTIDGHRLEAGEVAIQVYITALYPAGVGDKGVFSHQLKTTIGRVMSGVNKSYDGENLDAIFGYQGVSDRIVGSAESVGTTNSLALRLRELVIEAYRK